MIFCSNDDVVKLQGMVSQVVGEGSCCEWPSYVRGYHEYKSVWSPTVREVLRLTTEFTNFHNPYAVAVLKGSYKVGHSPRIDS